MALEQSQASLNAWKGAVDVEYTTILHSLLLRVLSIAIALGTIFILGEVWRRATTSYVKDIRRRRQLLVVRRLVIGFLSGLVMIFGLVTQFSSLATFAGFITAGLAVGLQTILLSVAAYFFIIGRYGVKVGDRITVAGVTGDVAEVGLVRFYVLELAGSGTDLYPSGRVAVFSNAVLFQAGTPLYKQLPGTEYLWHEMTVKLNQESDYRPATEAMLQSIQKVYDRYRQQIEQQHRQLESWMDTSLDLPGIQSSLQLVDGGLQFWVRFPVLIRQTTETDNRMTEALLATIASDAKVKAAVNSAPIVKAAVKG
jgi:small-conductance mechanosensitive channel